ncbi:hypothetical protein [Priestia megaterium]|uniref:hypothetical protein n=1 Tax=Priestia megaterium TaxID=1404 RepID=UPI00278A2FA0|nr:hypothetical protein [Priestia megaterium]MDQ0804727.1 hypothetical protein [Priestia megaterium]
MIVEWDVAKKDSTTVRTIITADALVRKDATSMTTMTTANVLARKNAISVMTMIHVVKKNIIVKTAVTMITALLFFNAKVKTPRLFS